MSNPHHHNANCGHQKFLHDDHFDYLNEDGVLDCSSEPINASADKDYSPSHSESTKKSAQSEIRSRQQDFRFIRIG